MGARMPLTEFDLIRHYLTGLGCQRADVLVGVGDDAACVQVPPDTTVTTIAASIRGAACGCETGEAFGYLSFAHALLCTLAANARPAWATLALTLPEIETEWVRGFATAVHTLAAEHGVSIVGGDTTEGPLLASFFVSALIEPSAGRHEDAASAGDAVYVVGKMRCESSAPLACGPALSRYASAATHARGGLRDGVMRLTRPRSLGATLWQHRLAAAVHGAGPCDAQTLLHTRGFLALCCLVPRGRRTGFETVLAEHGVPHTHVGRVEARPGIRIDSASA